MSSVNPFSSDDLNYAWRQYRIDNSDNEENTVSESRSQVATFDDWLSDREMNVKEIEHDQLIEFLFFLSENGGSNGDGLAASTIKKYWYSITPLFNYLHLNGRIDTNPVDLVKERNPDILSSDAKKRKVADDNELIDPLTRSDIQALVDNVPGPVIRNRLIIRLMYQTGIREHELRGITLDRHNPERRTIKIVDNKTDSSRVVAYQDSLLDLMATWLDGGHREIYQSSIDSDYMFPSRTSSQMQRNTVNEIVRKAAENAGIQEVRYVDAQGHERKRVTSHQLRHTFAVHAVDPNIGGGAMSLQNLRDAMGHEDISTTEVYLEYVEEKQIRAMRKTGPSLALVDTD